MSTPIVVGLTGTIGSGKSTVARMLESEGAYLIDADLLAREVVAPKSAGLAEVIATFGPQYLSSDGTLDRKKLGQVVFGDPGMRKKLETILHPRIRSLFKSKLEAVPAGTRIVVYVVPLLFESDLDYRELSAIVVVAASREQCISRIVQRDQCTAELAAQKLDSQIGIEQKTEHADFVIDNSRSLAETRAAAQKVYTQLMKLWEMRAR
ncbi:MAG: dephospho-CoA kinase [Bdellovibrionota bacterium]|nr:MAG: dephospho-CoA kinase [Bdellovibrionota bacterium]